jgi:hypothetical protein
MGNLQELERAVARLSPEELAAFRAWFLAHDAADWDRQFEADVRAGRLDALAEAARREHREGRCSDL